MKTKTEIRKVDYITQSAIISEYGWTKSLIEKFLPEPTLKRNPRYSCAAPMKLWDREVVLSVMENENFKKAFEKAKNRKKGGEKAANTKYKKLMGEIEEKISNIKVKIISEESLEYNVLNTKRPLYAVDNATMARWTVNFIRHTLTEYDSDIYDMVGKVGCNDAYLSYKYAVFDAIAKAYPQYKNECERQKQKALDDVIRKEMGKYIGV